MTPEQPKERGRPSVYTREIAAEICARLAAGESLRAICRDDHMPDESTVRGWALDNHQDFFPQYARAREIGYAGLFEQVLEIADTPQIGIKTVIKPTGTETTEGDMIEHRRLQIDARKWMLAKALPKVYGDRIENTTTHQFGDGNGQTYSLDELARRSAFLFAAARQGEKQPDPPALQ